MADTPPFAPEDARYIACPFCTIQIPEETVSCPHCRRALPPPGVKAGNLPRFAGGRFGTLPDLLRRYGLWVKAGVPVVLGIVVLLLVYGSWVRHELVIVRTASLPMQVKQEKKGKSLLIKGTVRNEGEDIPDLSLKSIGVTVDFVYRDGRRIRKTVFPKTEFRGEGALLTGETGYFEVESPPGGLKEVSLRAEVVDLGMGQDLIPPRGIPRRK